MKRRSCWNYAVAFLSIALQQADGQKDTFRKNYLDYLDRATLEYYIAEDTVEPFDVAVMFYAQRDQNCHNFAPIWQQIAKVLKAGTSESNLIFGLFDCEEDEASVDLCIAARVKTYPGLAYISLAGNHTIASKKPRKIVHYPASNWNQGEPLLDWIRAMSGLSKLHRKGWGKRVQNAIFGWTKKSKSFALSVGAPVALKTESKLLEAKKKIKDEKATATRTAEFVDATLFPLLIPDSPHMSDNGKNYTDIFAYLISQKAWDSKTPAETVLRTCVAEVSLDYCTRCSNKFTEDWASKLPVSHEITDEDITKFRKDLEVYFNTSEPFCGVMDDCIDANFTKTDCRPTKCPFSDRTGCRYLTTCFSETIQSEYADAMNLKLPVASVS